MIIDSKTIEPYKKFLGSLPMLNKGMQRLHKIMSWPTMEIPNKIEFIFHPLCEYMCFIEGVKLPFFKTLDSVLISKIEQLFNHILSSQSYSEDKLTYNEAFKFFHIIGKTKSRNLLNYYGSLNSAMYTDIINAVNNKDYVAFKGALSNVDCTDLMCTLRTLIYIMYGICDSSTIKDSSNIIENHWFDDHTYKFLFKLYDENNDGDNIGNQILRFIYVLPHKKRERLYVTSTNVSTKNIIECKYQHFDRDITEVLYAASKNPEHLQHIKKLYPDQEVIVKQCNNLVTSVFTEAFNAHKNEIADILQLRYVADNNNQGVKDINHSGITSLSNTGNCILIKHRPNIDIKSFFEAMDDMMWSYGADKYVEEDATLLRNYILLFSNIMVEILHMIKPILEEREFAVLQWIVSRSNYVINNQNEKGTHTEQPSTTIREEIPLTIDSNENHKSWFKKVLNSKIKGGSVEEKNNNLYSNLERLYYSLSNPDKGYIDPRTDKTLFIYRFSGFNNIYTPNEKIQWKRENTLLGYLIRCLMSDSQQGPELTDIASFFISRSGKPINLASAKFIKVTDFNKEKGSLPKLFVEAVEILQNCGFINVEFTSKRR